MYSFFHQAVLYLLTLFFLWSLFSSVMSMQEEVALSGNIVEGKVDDPKAIFKQAVKEVRQCLRVTKESLPKICEEIENASSRSIIRAVFRRLNSITQIFLRSAQEDRYRDLISKALCELEASPRLQSFLPTAG